MLRLIRNLGLLLVVARCVRFKPPAGFNLVVCLELLERRVIVIVEQTGTERRKPIAFLAGTGQNAIDSHLNIKCMEVAHGGCICGVPDCDVLGPLDIGEVTFQVPIFRPHIDCRGGDQ